MDFQEKSAWIMLSVLVLVYGWYFGTVFREVSSVGTDEVGYRGSLLFTVGALVVLAVASHVVAAIANPTDIDRSDERDKEINRYGEYVGGFALGAFALAALGMALFEVQHFWIANTILAGLVLSELTSLTTRIVLYRRGF